MTREMLFPSMKIDLENASMELWDFAQIHAVRPHCFQGRVDDDFLLGSERWSQSCLQLGALSRAERDCIRDDKWRDAAEPDGGEKIWHILRTDHQAFKD